jgi:hypothetical protein
MLRMSTGRQPNQDVSAPKPNSPTNFELWCKYEEVAMHFNDLIIRLRFQALAGLAGISAIVSIVGRSGSQSAGVSSNVLGGFFLLLVPLWIAIWVLDRFYYDKLLTGAIKAIRDLESSKGRPSHVPPSILLSTTIEREFRKEASAKRAGDATRGKWVDRIGAVARRCVRDGRDWFYLIVFATLVTGALLHFDGVRRLLGLL